MLIGLDAIPLTEPLTGVGHYTMELARALAFAAPAYEFELAYPSRYTPIDLAQHGDPPPPNLRVARVRVGVLGRRWWLVGLPRHARRRRFALFHGTNYEVPLRATCPTVLTIHDLSAFTHPETHVARRARRLRLRLPAMARAATMIITPSEFVRREACELLKIDPERVTSIPEAPRKIFRPLARDAAAESLRRLGIEGDFLLAVGTIEPRKNLTTLVRAFERITSAGIEVDARTDVDTRMDTNVHARADTRVNQSPLQLVVAGKEGWLTRELRALVAASPARERIKFTGYVADEDLRALYSACLAFVYPSVYEGFGLPPLEAMSCGAPVLASRIPAHLETLGERAALLFAPTDADELAHALSEVVASASLRQQLAHASRARAAAFTWDRTARLTLEVYVRAVREWAARREIEL
jgi:glycosyltransferase involved in cell wall biosynthesis